MAHNILPEEVAGRIFRRHLLLSSELAVFVGLALSRVLKRPIHRNEITRLAIIFFSARPRILRKGNTHNRVALMSERVERSIACHLFEYAVTKYPDFISRLDCLEPFQLSSIQESQYDLIVTDQSPEALRDIHIPVLRYQFNLEQEDDRALRRWYENRDHHWALLREFFSPDLFFEDCDVRGREDALKLAAALIIETRRTGPELTADLLLRDKLSSASLGNGLAAMKTIRHYGTRSWCAVFSFRKPVFWEEDTVQRLFILNVGIDCLWDVVRFFGELERYFIDSSYTLPMLQKQSYTEFIDFLGRMYLQGD